MSKEITVIPFSSKVLHKWTSGGKDTNILIAKAADELLTINGINCSFVLGEFDEKVYISGRSIGDINVQIILEKLKLGY